MESLITTGLFNWWINRNGYKNKKTVIGRNFNIADILIAGSPSIFNLKKEASPPASSMELISKGLLLRLYTLKLRVAEPMVVKTVSKVTVSVENPGSALGSGPAYRGCRLRQSQ